MESEIKQELAEIKSELKGIGITLARNTESLIHHSARTQANESRIQKMENWILGILTTGVLGALGVFAKKLLG